jgi:hypothetical protein
MVFTLGFLIWTYAKSSAIITTKGSEWVLGITNDRFLKISELKGIPLMAQKTGILNII